MLPPNVPQARAPEIVTVISECRLVNSAGKEWLYWRRDGRGLAPGVYVAVPHVAAARRGFNEDTVFRGPFRDRAEAQAFLAAGGHSTGRHGDFALA